jgi:hypothetical protein
MVHGKIVAEITTAINYEPSTMNFPISFYFPIFGTISMGFG